MRSPIVIGMLHPLSLLMLGLSLFAGLVAAWWLFPVGLVFWLLMALAVSRDPALRLDHEIQSRAPIAPRFQPYFDRIQRVQVRLFTSLASTPSRTRRVLEPVQTEVDALTAQVHRLCRRMTALENYRLVTESKSNLQSDLGRINDAIDTATDPRVKEEYEESRRVLVQRIARLKLVSTELDRVEAHLLSLANRMDGTITELTRIQALNRDDAARRVQSLVDSIREQSEQLSQFEQEVVNF